MDPLFVVFEKPLLSCIQIKKKTGYFLFSSIWTHPFVRDDTVHSDKSEVVKVKDHYGF